VEGRPVIRGPSPKALALPTVILALAAAVPVRANPPIHIAFHWHMHQPVYWPYETLVETANRGAYGFDVLEVHRGRTGAYTAWPMDAVQAGMDAGLGALGAQVSLSGSLMENLDAIEAAGAGFGGWRNRWREAAGWRTEGENPRIDLVAFGYHHPLMALIDPRDVGLQIELHREKLARALAAPASKGIFPPETGFAEWMIPALVGAGIEWVLIDNVHFDRARTDYPYTPSSNLVPPNRADQRNEGAEVAWVQLNDIWAPSRVAAPWGYQPHWVEWVDPESGESSRVVAVPAAPDECNEDARGGFGALQYDAVLSQYAAHNTDDAHPMLIVLHHDGDNFGGGTESYYHGNFGAFVQWLRDNPDRFVCTTVQDYLDRYPPADDDVIHVEAGSWSGADNGDAEFLKWNGDPDEEGYSPDRASWAVITAAHNRVRSAEQARPISELAAVLTGGGTDTDRAWHHLLNGEASDYWYWDRSEDGLWDSHPTRAANLAVGFADRVLADGPPDRTPPSLYAPQREPYNPGGIEWGDQRQPSDFDVWTFAYDVSGLTRVVLRYRVDPDGRVDAENLLHAGGGWAEVDMVATRPEVRTDPAPTYVADEYRAGVAGFSDVLVDYYVEAEDGQGNVGRSPLLHVWVGASQQGGGGPDVRPDPDGVQWAPLSVCPGETLTVRFPSEGHLHWGVDGWTTPPEVYWPEGTEDWGDGKAVETPLTGPDADDRWSATLGPFDAPEAPVSGIDFVLRLPGDRWENNDGNDFHVAVRDACGGTEPGEDAGPVASDAGGEPDEDAGGGGTEDAGRQADGGGGGGDAAPWRDVGPGGPGADEPTPDADRDGGCGCRSLAGRHTRDEHPALGWLIGATPWTRRR